MSVESCVRVAEALGAKFAGVEYGIECWVGDGLGGEGINSVVGEGECDFSCGGARGELCGGRNRMNLWRRIGGV